MRHLFIQILFFSLSFSLTAQTLLPIANDPAVVTGHTGNGLTYYLIKDINSHRGFADFYMAQKWGTSVETPAETGFTSLLAGMNLLESRGFPDGSMFSDLGALGIPLDLSLVSDIGTDDVIMGLKDVPVTNSPAFDQVLSALINMCSGAEVNRQTLDSGMAFLYNGSARLQSPALRERADLLKSLFPSENSLYVSAEDELENVFEADVQHIWEFQKTWFRPETQALIIVGDIDVDAMKSKISLISSTLSRGSGTAVPVFTPDLKAGQEVFHSYIDRESDMAYLTADFLQKPVAQSERGTHIALVREYIGTLLRCLLDSRINSLKRDLTFPIYRSDVRQGDFCGLNGTDALSITLVTTPDHIYEASEFLSSVLTGLRKGISEYEFKDAVERCQSSFTSRPDYVSGSIRHYLKGYSLPSSDVKSEYAAKLRKTFGAGQMNAYISSYIEKDTYRIIHCMSPDDVSDSQLRDSFDRGRRHELLPPGTSASLPVPVPKTPVKLKSPVTEPVTGSLIYTLPNYSKVYFRKNDSEPGQISLMAISRGGLSLSGKSHVYLSRYINDLADLSLPDIPASWKMSLQREFTPDRAYLKGNCRTEDLELFFQLISRSFSDCRMEKTAFGRRLEELTLKEVCSFVSPTGRLDDMISVRPVPKQDFSVLDLQTANDFLSKACSNIGGYTFLIAGDCPENLMKEYIEKYLAPIQGKRPPQSLPIGVFTTGENGAGLTVEMPEEVPVYRYGLRISNEYSFSLQGVITAKIISSLIRQKVAENLFAEGISVSSSEDFIKTPKNILSIGFKMASPDESSFYEKIIDETLKDLEANGVPDDRIEAARQYVAATYMKKASAGNTYWLEVMEARVNGKDFISQRDATLSAITCGEINDFLKRFLSSATRKTAHIVPEILQIPELPPIEFETPFPEPLDTTIDLSALLGRPLQDDAAPEDTASEGETPAEDGTEAGPTTESNPTTEATDTVNVRQAVISDISDK